MLVENITVAFNGCGTQVDIRHTNKHLFARIILIDFDYEVCDERFSSHPL